MNTRWSGRIAGFRNTQNEGITISSRQTARYIQSFRGADMIVVSALWFKSPRTEQGGGNYVFWGLKMNQNKIKTDEA